MEVKPGYKQTEVSVIPEEWELVTLDDCLELLTDFEANGSFEHVARNVRVYDIENFAWYVRATDLENDTPITNVRYVDEPSYRFLKKTALIGGEVLITKRGDIGKVYLFERKTGYATLAPNLYLLKLNDQVLPEYVFAYFKHGGGNRTLKNINASTTLGALYKNDVKAIILPRPPLPEQRAIAGALSDVDALIGGLDRLIAKKRDLKQAAMQQVLTGQTRLPGFHGEWEVKRLGELCHITTGKKDVNEGNPSGQYPFFTCARTNTFSDSFSFEGEAILIAGNGEVGNLNYCNGRFEAYQRTYVLQGFTANVSYLWHQLAAYLASSLGIGKIGSSIPYIKMGDLVGFEFRSPLDVNEQAAIATVLSDMDAEIAVLEARHDKTRALKQGMMQELLSGRIRLI